MGWNRASKRSFRRLWSLRALAAAALACGCSGQLNGGDGDSATDGDLDADGDADADADGDIDGDADADEVDGGDGDTDGDGLPWDGWIGSPCRSSEDCSYDEAVCASEAPDGMCTLACDQLCPDRDGFPVTFCVDAAVLPDEVSGFPEGACFSRCDYGAHPGTGCRDGYGCVPMPRANEPGTERYTCVPGMEPDPLTDCERELADLGVSFEPTVVGDEHPDTNPELTCHIDDPVIVHPPIHGVDFAYYDGTPTPNILAACNMALALVRTADSVVGSGVTQLRHYGTYNCRVIAGTDTLSRHAYADAIDVYGFEFSDGRLWTVIDDWEHDTESFSTEAGAWLYETAHGWYDDYVWNIVLTPNYNTAHDNHFHVDLTPSRHVFHYFPIPTPDGRYFGPAPYDD